jgi:hypothetical protein
MRQDATRRNDIPDIGDGSIAAFDLNGNLLNTFVAQGPLNSPWALSLAPATFGDFAQFASGSKFRRRQNQCVRSGNRGIEGELADTQGNTIGRNWRPGR